jgi:diaminopimelate epimerase
VRFEKWHALGNDYVIVEAGDLPGPLAPAVVRALCDRHTGIGADGILELRPPDEPGFVARLRIFNPDGSEAELSGNGAREAIMYLRHRGWTDRSQFSIQTGAGEIRPTILSDTTCRVDMGRAALRSKDFPAGGDDGIGEVRAGGRTWRFQHVSVGNPQCAIAMRSVEELEALDLPAIGPGIEHSDLFPNRTNVSWFAELEPGVIRARIFERGVGETTASGTGATGAAVAYVLRGGGSPVTVRLDGGELEVEVGDDLHIDLTGWAVPVYRGELSDADAVFAQRVGE